MGRALLIVVAILIFLGGFVVLLIPFFLRSAGHGPNEHPAVATLRTINTAEVTYLSYSGGNYGDLAALVSAGLLDSRFGGIPARKGGYNFFVSWSSASPRDYTAYAEPVSSKTGKYGYYSFPDAIVRYSTHTATSNGKPGKAVN